MVQELIQGAIAGLGVWRLAVRSVTFIGPDEVGARHNKLSGRLTNVFERLPDGSVRPIRGMVPHLPFVSGVIRVPTNTITIDPAEEGAEIMLKYNGTPVPGFKPNVILTARANAEDPAQLIRSVGVRNARNFVPVLAGYAKAALQILQGADLEKVQEIGMHACSAQMTGAFNEQVEENFGTILSRGQVSIINLTPPEGFSKQMGEIGADRNFVDAVGAETAVRLTQAREGRLIIVDSGSGAGDRRPGRRALMQSVVAGVVAADVAPKSGPISPFNEYD